MQISVKICVQVNCSQCTRFAFAFFQPPVPKAYRTNKRKHGTRNFGSENVWIHDFYPIILPRHLWRLPVPADAATAWLRPQRASSRAGGGVCSLIGSVVQKWGLNQLSSWWFPICITQNPVVPLMYCCFISFYTFYMSLKMNRSQ